MSMNPYVHMYHEGVKTAQPLELPPTAWPLKGMLLGYDPERDMVKILNDTGISRHSEKEFAAACDSHPDSQASWLFTFLKTSSALFTWRIVVHP